MPREPTVRSDQYRFEELGEGVVLAEARLPDRFADGSGRGQFDRNVAFVRSRA